MEYPQIGTSGEDLDLVVTIGVVMLGAVDVPAAVSPATNIGLRLRLVDNMNKPMDSKCIICAKIWAYLLQNVNFLRLTYTNINCVFDGMCPRLFFVFIYEVIDMYQKSKYSDTYSRV